jgi:hypothetical protein
MSTTVAGSGTVVLGPVARAVPCRFVTLRPPGPPSFRTTQSSVLAPDTKPVESVNGVKAPQPVDLLPLARPLTKTSSPALSVRPRAGRHGRERIEPRVDGERGAEGQRREPGRAAVGHPALPSVIQMYRELAVWAWAPLSTATAAAPPFSATV